MARDPYSVKYRRMRLFVLTHSRKSVRLLVFNPAADRHAHLLPSAKRSELTQTARDTSSMCAAWGQMAGIVNRPQDLDDTLLLPVQRPRVALFFPLQTEYE